MPSSVHLPESVFAPLPNAQRGVPLILTGDPKGQNFLYCVGNSVIIRNIEVRRGGGGWRERGRVEGEGKGGGGEGEGKGGGGGWRERVEGEVEEEVERERVEGEGDRGGGLRKGEK